MKKFGIALCALTLGTVAASAADLPARTYTKAPPPPVVAAYDWSGFYIGIDGGGGWGHKCWDITQNGTSVLNSPVAEGCHDPSGGTVGGQIGYRWQSAAWVFGVEAEGNWANFRAANPSQFYVVPAGTFYNRTTIEAFGLFTGQVGYAWDKFLLYVKGGAAVTSDRYEGYLNAAFGRGAAGAVFDSATETRWGGVVGVGAEYALSPNWSVALEYDHLFMGTNNLTLISTGTIGTAGVVSRVDNIRQDVDIVTARINYKFGGPVVAKY
jgi:outer membrane immunogenic protein